MRGYAGIDLVSSSCIHFVRNNEIDDSLSEIFEEVRSKNIKIAYIDYVAVIESGRSVVGCIADDLSLSNRPHDEENLWSFLDDLITLAYSLDGLIIIIDRSEIYLEREQRNFFDLVEAFLIQFHHWFENSKPCHLCFQMEENPILRSLAV